MFLKVNNEYRVNRVGNFYEDGNSAFYLHNGQHAQLYGHILVEIRFVPEIEILLLHPETGPESGHVDMYYHPSRNVSENWFRLYANQFPGFDATKPLFRQSWPTGPWNLFCTVNAIENFLQDEIGYQPRLGEWLCTHLNQSLATTRKDIKALEQV